MTSRENVHWVAAEVTRLTHHPGCLSRITYHASHKIMSKISDCISQQGYEHLLDKVLIDEQTLMARVAE